MHTHTVIYTMTHTVTWCDVWPADGFTLGSVLWPVYAGLRANRAVCVCVSVCVLVCVWARAHVGAIFRNCNTAAFTQGES